MAYALNPNVIREIWEALSSPPRRSIRVPISTIRRITQEGWASSSDLEDLLFEMDSRLDRINIRDITEALQLPWRSVFYIPRSRSVSVFGSEALSATDSAEFLICFEQLGFNIDPTPLVESLLKQVKKLPKITGSELSVIWFNKMRHKMAPVTLQAPGELRRICSSHTYTTPTGYRAELSVDSENLPIRMTVHAPKFRRRKEPVETICTECGLTYYRGDPDSSTAHRKEHKERLAYLRPQPHKAFLEARLSEAEPELVNIESPVWKHREMYLRAAAFRREFHYDFVQWGDPDDDPDAHGFLFADEDGSIVGACAFRRRSHEDRVWWGLQWVWVCPQARRKGALTHRWSTFRKRFGDFRIEGPVSEAMERFAVKQGDTKLLGYQPSAQGSA